MNNSNKRISRRDFLRGSAAVAGMIPLVQLGSSQAWAAALQYAEDATTRTRPDKAGVPGSEQVCGNCALYTAPGEGMGPCALFQGRLVTENGWCSAWAPKG